MTSIAVVGGSLAGLSTVRGLRAEGYDGSITVIGEERHPRTTGRRCPRGLPQGRPGGRRARARQLPVYRRHGHDVAVLAVDQPKLFNRLRRTLTPIPAATAPIGA